MDERLGVAVIGAGDRGRAYSRVWSELDGIKLIAICDLIEERYRNLKEKFNYDYGGTDYVRAVTRKGVDIVTVCVPAAFHAEMTVFSLKQGRHVLLEKPMALSYKGAERMKVAAEEEGLALGLGMQYRYRPLFRKFKRAFSEGLIGRPALVRFSDVRQIRDFKPAMHDPLEGNAGPTVDMSPHLTDLTSWYTGSEPLRVMAQGLTFAQGSPELEQLETKAIDTTEITVEYESGDICSLTICWGLPPGIGDRFGHEILGPKGMVTMEDEDVYLSHKMKENGVEKVELKDPHPELPYPELALTEDFLRAVRGEKDKPETAAGEGLRALAISLAALQSSKTGRAVGIEEVLRSKPQVSDFLERG